MRAKRLIPRLAVATLATGLFVGGMVVPSASAAVATSADLAAGKAVSASSSTSTAANVNDGRQDSYWESAGNTLPQWIQVDLGSTQSVDQLVLKVPDGWHSQAETLAVQGSADGAGFMTAAVPLVSL